MTNRIRNRTDRNDETKTNNYAGDQERKREHAVKIANHRKMLSADWRMQSFIITLAVISGWFISAYYIYIIYNMSIYI